MGFGVGGYVSMVTRSLTRGGLQSGTLRGEETHTQRNVVIALDGDILGFLDVVHALEDGQAVSNTSHAHRLEIIVEQSYKSFANDLVLWTDAQPQMLDRMRKETKKRRSTREWITRTDESI